jgi:hypothetical protein
VFWGTLKRNDPERLPGTRLVLGRLEAPVVGGSRSDGFSAAHFEVHGGWRERADLGLGRALEEDDLGG